MTRIIVDCTLTFQTGASTGIQRMVRRVADSLLELAGDEAGEVVPVRISGDRLIALPVEAGRVRFPRARSARGELEAIDRRHRALHRWGHRANRVLHAPGLARWLDAGPNEEGLARWLSRGAPAGPGGDLVEIRAGDVFLAADSSWVYDVRSVLDRAGAAGATRAAIVCDVLPLTHPEFFTAGTVRYFRGWLREILPRLDAIVTISDATRDELAALASGGLGPLPAVRTVHLGSEVTIVESGPVRPELAASAGPDSPPLLLTVGTFEPRKNVGFALDIYDELVARDVPVQWHFVGAMGWLAEEAAARIRAHARQGSSLFWWEDLSDVELAWCYRNASALVAVSSAEGFGLPLVEARRHGLAVFASDIAVFREVLGNEGRYLPLGSARLSAAALEDFLAACPGAAARRPTAIARTWMQCAREIRDWLVAVDGARRAGADAAGRTAGQGTR